MGQQDFIGGAHMPGARRLSRRSLIASAALLLVAGCAGCRHR